MCGGIPRRDAVFSENPLRQDRLVVIDDARLRPQVAEALPFRRSQNDDESEKPDTHADL